MDLVAVRRLPLEAGDLHPPVLPNFAGVQPPQRGHHRSLGHGMRDVRPVLHLQPVQYVPLDRLQEVEVHPFGLVRRSVATGSARLLGCVLRGRAGRPKAARAQNARHQAGHKQITHAHGFSKVCRSNAKGRGSVFYHTSVILKLCLIYKLRGNIQLGSKAATHGELHRGRMNFQYSKCNGRDRVPLVIPGRSALSSNAPLLRAEGKSSGEACGARTHLGQAARPKRRTRSLNTQKQQTELIERNAQEVRCGPAEGSNSAPGSRVFCVRPRWVSCVARCSGQLLRDAAAAADPALLLSPPPPPVLSSSLQSRRQGLRTPKVFIQSTPRGHFHQLHGRLRLLSHDVSAPRIHQALIVAARFLLPLKCFLIWSGVEWSHLLVHKPLICKCPIRTTRSRRCVRPLF